MHLARRKARLLRKQCSARCLVQRVFRGFASRKRSIATFTKLYIFYNRIGHLAHKYMVIRAARSTHRRILVVQAFGRMIGPYTKYKLLQYALRSLQIKWRYYARTHTEKLYKAYLARERLRLLLITQNKAAAVIQPNWKSSFFNKTMAPFILICCLPYTI